MHQGHYVFAQLMQYLPLTAFRRCVGRYHGERKVKRFTCLVAIIKNRLQLSASLYVIIHILSPTLFKKTPLDQLLDDSAVQITPSRSKRSKSRGDGMILRFPSWRESDSFWGWYRLPILTACPPLSSKAWW